jgi:GAF domain-containing protein
VLATPLLREGIPIGAIHIRRMEVRPFTDKQIKLLETFAAQAVIAIENVRLFQELKESLEQQTATSEILGVIASSPTDIQPVLDVVAKNAARLGGATDAQIRLVEGDGTRLVASYGSNPAPAFMPLNSPSMRAVLQREQIHFDDLQATMEAESPTWGNFAADIAARTGTRTRTFLSTPMLREGTPIGLINVRRTEVRPFSENQMALLRTFADQAVIAIENVRLFKELGERNAELREALEHQTATSEILRAISSSPTDLQPVFETILANATRLCGTRNAGLYRFDGELLHFAAGHNLPPEMIARQQSNPHRPGRESANRRAALERRTIHVPDVQAAVEFDLYQTDVNRRVGRRSTLAVPLLKEHTLLGVIVTSHYGEVRPFTDNQIKLVETFADQAVIAIENVRLFKELNARTNELTRSVGELRALGEVSQAVSSTLDLETVLTRIVSHAVQLSGTDGGAIYEYDEASEEFQLRATDHMEEELIAALRANPPRLGDGVVGRAALSGEPMEISDISESRLYAPRMRALLARFGFRASLAVPLLREDRIIGGLVVRRKSTGEFRPEVIELLKTFATQSALAIQNARLFREIEDKSRQIEAANRHKSEFLANMSHELRTPLMVASGYLQMLQKGVMTGDQLTSGIETVSRNVQQIATLVNDILFLQEMDLVLPEFQTVDMNEIARSVTATYEEKAKERSVNLRFKPNSSLPSVSGDFKSLERALMALVDNAIKFSPKGGDVEISLNLRGDTVQVAVKDHGIGIATENQPRIFDRFYHLERHEDNLFLMR